ARRVDGLPRASVKAAQVLGRLLLRRRRRSRRRRGRRRGLGADLLLTTDDVVIVLRPLGLSRGRRFFAQLTLGAGAEGLFDAVHGAEDGVVRLRERPRRPPLQRGFHGVDEDRPGGPGPGFTAAQRAGVVEADEDADHDVGREADEPGRTIFIGGARLAADPWAQAAGTGAGAALDHALQHGGHLIGGDGVDHLGPAILKAGRFLAAEAPAAVAALATVG